MPVVIIDNNPRDLFPLNVDDMVEGEAYESDCGDIYICNRYGDIVAFSIRGEHIAFDDTDRKYRKITLECKVIRN